MESTGLVDITLIHNYAVYLRLTDPEEIKRIFNELLKVCDYQVLNFMEHKFQPVGYTCIWLLGESHLAIHTFPEKDMSYVELSSCSEVKNQKFRKLLETKYESLLNL